MLRIAGQPAGDPDDVLPWELLRDLRELIPCDGVTVWGCDPILRTTFAEQDLSEAPAVVLMAGSDEDNMFWTHFWDCLDCSYPDRTGDIESVTITSDFYSDRALHDTGMYVDFSRGWGSEREIRVCVPADRGLSLRLLFWRGPGADFTERDRAVLTLLRPHLMSVYAEMQRARRVDSTVTERQREIMSYVTAGYTNAQIARRLRLSEGTVRKHLENVFARLGVTSRTAAAARVGLDLLDLPRPRAIDRT